MALNGLIFDLDGTLANTLPICVAAFRAVFAQLGGRSYTDEEITALFGMTEEGTIRQVLGENWRVGLDFYLREYERRHVVLTEPFAGMRELLDELHRLGIRLALVTGKGAESAEISLRVLGLRDDFEFVEVGSAEGPIKPRGLRRILGRWEFPAQQVAYVGDTGYDMQAAAGAGMVGLGAAWAATATVRQAASGGVLPAAVFSQPQDLMVWVRERRNVQRANGVGEAPQGL